MDPREKALETARAIFQKEIELERVKAELTALRNDFFGGVAAPPQTTRPRGRPVEPNSGPERIVAALAASPGTAFAPSDVAQRLGLQNKTVGKAMARLTMTGRLERAGPGKYRLKQA